MIKKWVKSWLIFKLYHPPGITRTSVTGKIYGNANGGLRYRTSRDRFRQLKYKMKNLPQINPMKLLIKLMKF